MSSALKALEKLSEKRRFPLLFREKRVILYGTDTEIGGDMADIERFQVGFTKEIYDSWDTGARRMILHRKISLLPNPQFPLSPVQFSDESRRDKRWFKHNNYPKLAVELVLSGAVEYRMEDRSLIASAGECCILPPGTTVLMVNSGDRWRRKLCLIVAGLALEVLVGAFGFRQLSVIRVPEPEKLAAAMRHIGDMMGSPKSTPLELSTAVYELLGRLSVFAEQGNIPSPLFKTVKFMQGNLHRSITMEELIAIAGCSEASLRRRFHREFGLSPFAFLRDMRLRKGAEILKRGSDIPIKMLSYECGFASVPSFIKAFRECFGATPGVWKNRNNELFR